MGLNQELNVKIITAKDVSWPCTVAVLEDGTEIPRIKSIDFHHRCDETPTAIIEVLCEKIEVDACGILTTTFMGKKYCLTETT